MRTFIGILGEPGERKNNIIALLVAKAQERGDHAAIVSMYAEAWEEVQNMIIDLRGAKGALQPSQVISYVSDKYEIPISAAALAQTYAVQHLDEIERGGKYDPTNKYVQRILQILVEARRDGDEEWYVDAWLEKVSHTNSDWIICDDLLLPTDVEMFNEYGIVIRIADSPDSSCRDLVYADFTYDEFDPDEFIEEVTALKQEVLYVQR